MVLVVWIVVVVRGNVMIPDCSLHLLVCQLSRGPVRNITAR